MIRGERRKEALPLLDRNLGYGLTRSRDNGDRQRENVVLCCNAQ